MMLDSLKSINYKSLSRVVSLAVILIPSVLFLAWALNIGALRTTFHELPFAYLNIVLIFMFAGFSLHFFSFTGNTDWKVQVGQGFAFLVTGASAATLGQFIFRDAGQQSYLWTNSFIMNGSLPGEPSTHTAVMFFLVGLSLLLQNSQKFSYLFFAQFFILISTLIILMRLFDVMGSAFNSHEVLLNQGMALSIALLFLILCFGVLFSCADRGLLAIVTGKTMGGIMLRRVLPFTLTVPLVLGWLRLQGEKASFYDSSFGVSLMVFVTMVCVNLIICWNARMIHSLDEERRQSAQKLEQANFSLEAEVVKRTQELSQTNNRLKKEMQERQVLEKEISDYLKERSMSQGDLLKYASIVESSDDAIMGNDVDGTITSWNRGAEEIYGYFAGDVIGRNISMLFPDEKRQEIERMKEKIKRGEGVKHYETTHVRKDKSQIYVSLTISPLRDADGNVIGDSTIARDVTERKRVEKILDAQKKALEKSNLELDSFVYTASHDLRAPLRTVASFASFLEEDYETKLDKKGKDYLLKIRRGATRMSKLIDDLLTLSQISRMENPYEDVDILGVIDTVLERLEYDIQKNNVQIKIQKNIPVIHCDRIKITEVFVNLIHNAIKFSSKNSKETPSVSIGYADEGNTHVFFVKDNGIGIEAEYHDQIFGFLRRLHTTQEYEGNGAGLSIVKRIVDDHSGQIWVKSALGEGATFYFTVPKGLKNKKKLGEILVDEGLIDKDKLRQVLERQMSGNEQPSEPKEISHAKKNSHHR